MYTEAEVTSIRGELEIAQKALKLQTRRCRQLVAEYTKRLQEKEQQYQSEKSLRDNQLAKVLKALLIFEARLKQKQKFISRQLNEKDYVIKDQSNSIMRLLKNQYCKNCNQYYRSSPPLDNLDSSSEYVITEYQEYQSSNFESLDSSSETYERVSDKGHSKSDNEVETSDSNRNLYQKNKNNSLGRQSRKSAQKKNIGTYYEVLKLRSASPLSNDDNTSLDYDNLDSLSPESISDKISLLPENIESIFNKSLELKADNASDSSTALSLSECNSTVVNKNLQSIKTNQDNIQYPTVSSTVLKQCTVKKSSYENSNENNNSNITEVIPIFDGDGEINENWYTSASDQEYEEQNNEYKDNPVLECVNQILLQNMNDPLISPPETPNTERKPLRNKGVKFSDEDKNENRLTEEILRGKQEDNHNYYETPNQNTPNFYETPQSIYSNDYEQILSKCNESFSNSLQHKNVPSNLADKKVNHYYVEMENKTESESQGQLIRKSKILRKPPALPPKPLNLVSKYKLQSDTRKNSISDFSSKESEPDYCSISELNLPQNNHTSFKQISVVAEVHVPTNHNVATKLKTVYQSQSTENIIKKVDLVVKKCVEKLNIQLANHGPIKETALQNSQNKIEQEIPKLPQVSEIIIPDGNEEKENEEERISEDNYVVNNSQILKSKPFETRKPIMIGSSVSSLISGFNNHQILSDIKRRKPNIHKKLFSSFESLQNVDKHFSTNDKSGTLIFENFDLSQNFEEFKLDDCEIEEYNVEDELNEEEPTSLSIISKDITNSNTSSPQTNHSTRVEFVRATADMLLPNLNSHSVDLLKKHMILQANRTSSEDVISESRNRVSLNEPTYEHFLECTGLSSKSILTPSRLLSNHKSMLKPKDVKLRSKVRANNGLFERHSGPSTKYWSEPYI